MHLRTLFFRLQKPRNLWFFVFVYILLTGLFVQLILLPHIVPSLHAGAGLLKGLDANKFHHVALERARLIVAFGWDRWDLLAQGQLVSGIASFFYALISPSPWVVLPWNAALHATASLCIYLVVLRIIEKPSISFIAILPFIFFPSNLMWNAQFLNENYAVPGIAMLLYGWSVLVSPKKNGAKESYPESILALGAISLGSLLFGLVRREVFSGLVFLFIPVAVLGVLFWITRETKKTIKMTRIIFLITALFIMVGAIYGLRAAWRKAYYQAQAFEAPATSKNVQNAFQKWQRSTWLPEFIDQNLMEIARYRNSFIQKTYAGSNIDGEITFENAWDLLSYIPRAVQIAFLSPFPKTWFDKGFTPGGTAMRIVSGLEMVIVYFSLIGLPWFFRKYLKQPAVWAVLLVCVGMLIIYAITIPNVGSLYRFRYPYLMPVVCFGLVGWLE